MTSLKEQFQNWAKNNQLLCLCLVKSKVGRETIWGRIINFNEADSSLLIYHEDEKKTLNIFLHEIEDIQSSEKLEKSSAKSRFEEKEKAVNIIKKETEFPSVREEVENLISKLPNRELYALLPIIKLMNKIHQEQSNS